MRYQFRLPHTLLLPAFILLSRCGALPAQIPGGSFSNTGNDTTPRYFHAASTLPDGTVMVAGGLGLSIFPSPTLVSLDALSFFDPQSGTFSSSFVPLDGGAAVSPTLATARSSHTQTTLPDGRVLITGGHVNAVGTSPGTPTASVELFDPFSGMMSSGPAMTSARTMHTATLLPDGRVVLAGGSTWQVFSSDADGWSTNFSLQRSRTSHAAVLLKNFSGVASDHRVLLIGGGGSGADTMELLDPASGTSSLLASTLTIGVDDLAAVRLPDNTVLIVGGQNISGGDTIDLTYLLDPASDVITPLDPVPDRPGGLADHHMIRIGRWVMVFGGEQQLSGSDTELDYAALFDTATLTWLTSGAMNNTHDDFAATVLDDESILLIDGGFPFFGQSAPSDACEVFTLSQTNACVFGDLAYDDSVALDDLPALTTCLTGPGVVQDDLTCLCADADEDGDVDLADVAVWLRY